MVKPMDLAALVLVIVGAVNWALIGLFEFDLVATLTGSDFGETNIVSRVVYILVGAAGLWLLSLVARGVDSETARH
jgi:uncharacterized protein